MAVEIDLKKLESDYSMMSATDFALLKRSALTPEAAEIYDKVAVLRKAADDAALAVATESTDTPSPDTALPQEAPDSEAFGDIVEWAYNTLPQHIKDLPDFPGIQVVDELPAGLLEEYPDHANAWGLFVGRSRIEREYMNLHRAPELIFVFQGPLIRYSRTDQKVLRANVKRTVWHEVAHWLGYNEDGVEELGL